MREKGDFTAAADRPLSVPSEYLTEERIQKGLNTVIVGRRVYSFNVLKSTNDYAFRLAEEGAEEGIVVVAEQQTAGRGRFGRTWYSPPRVGLWFSIMLRPEMAPWEAPRITLVAALAAARSVCRVTGLPAVLKWPNDVLINTRKACGILTELSAEAERINFVVIGIGVNVNQIETDFPPDIRRGATSLRIECGHTVSRLRLLQTLLAELESAYSQMMDAGFASLRGDIKSTSCLLNRMVSVRVKNRTYRGHVRDITEQGGLVVHCANGRTEHIIAGDVNLIDE